MEIQKEYKALLEKMIVETEREEIQSSEQLIQALINELLNGNLVLHSGFN